jgi:hypothetical protein
VSTTAIGSLVPRRRATVAGTIRAMRTHERPYHRTDAELDDGTGLVVLRFVGRTRMPGITTGARLFATGTPAVERDALVILNPLYCLGPAE